MSGLVGRDGANDRRKIRCAGRKAFVVDDLHAVLLGVDFAALGAVVAELTVFRNDGHRLRLWFCAAATSKKPSAEETFGSGPYGTIEK